MGLCPSISFEGQAAIELEMIAGGQENGLYEFSTDRDGEKARPIIEEIRRLVDELVRVMKVCGAHTVAIAWTFVNCPNSLDYLSIPFLDIFSI